MRKRIIKKRVAARKAPGLDETVHAEISRAILEGKLAAGTKLAEHELAGLFGVSRERIRKVLHRLGAERRIEIIPNRGAFIPRPTAADVKSVYEAHRALEAGVLAQLAPNVDDDLLGILDRHVAQERAAAEAGDRAASVRLSGAFHLHLVDALGNAHLSHFLRELISRSSVIVSIYEPASQSICAVDEHAGIVEALRTRDAGRAMALSHRHFQHVESRLALDRAAKPELTLATVFGGFKGSIRRGRAAAGSRKVLEAEQDIGDRK